MASVYEVAAQALTQKIAAHRVTNEVERVLFNYDLTLPQFAVLAHSVDGVDKLGCVADALGISRGNLTGIGDRLEAKGLVTRVRSTEDRRAYKMTLTPAGVDLLERIKKEAPAVELLSA